MKQENIMILNGVKYLLFTEEELEEQKLLAVLENNANEILEGRRKTIPVEQYKQDIEKKYGRKLF